MDRSTTTGSAATPKESNGAASPQASEGETRLRGLSTASSRSGASSIVTSEKLSELAARIAASPTLAAHPHLSVDEGLLTRFLKARNQKVDKAYDMWEKWAAWVIEFKPEQIRREEVESVLTSRTLMAHGQDKQGRGTLYVKLANHVPSPSLTALSIRAAVYCIEEAIRASEHNGAKGFIVVIWDHQGCNLKNFDTSLLIGKGGLIQLMQDYYPERLSCVHVINTDWVFQTLWKMISPFLDERTRGKVSIVSNPTSLATHFELEQLLAEYHPLVCPPPSPPAAASTETTGRRGSGSGGFFSSLVSKGKKDKAQDGGVQRRPSKEAPAHMVRQG